MNDRPLVDHWLKTDKGCCTSEQLTQFPWELTAMIARMVERNHVYTCGLRDNGVRVPFSSQLALDESKQRSLERYVDTPTLVDCLCEINVTQAASGWDSTLCVDDEGKLWGFGAGSRYVLWFCCHHMYTCVARALLTVGLFARSGTP